MAVKICECIGICNVDKNGSITELQREFFGREWIPRPEKRWKERIEGNPLIDRAYKMICAA